MFARIRRTETARREVTRQVTFREERYLFVRLDMDRQVPFVRSDVPLESGQRGDTRLLAVGDTLIS